MADLSPNLPPPRQESIPFWRDGRVLGVLGQIAFVIVVVLIAAWFLNNITQNISELGGFRCQDGSSSFACGFNFLQLDAQFDISESLIDYDPSNPYLRALLVGALNTAKVGIVGIVLTTMLGTLAGIARLSNNWLISNIAKWYVDIFRNTPLLLQLFFLFFAVILLFPSIQNAIQPFGLPVFLSQRGINLPGPVFMPSFATWLAFIFLGVGLAMIVWLAFGRLEERTGKPSRRLTWSILTFLVVIIIGWYAAGASAADNQGFLTANATRVREYSDLEDIMLGRLRLDSLSEIEAAINEGEITTEQVNEAAYTVCSIRDDNAEANLTAQLRADNIPFTMNRSNRFDQATEKYNNGECELYVASKVNLTAQGFALTEPTSNRLVPVTETPVRIALPRIEGLNFVGGIKLTPNFAAILLGLVLYTGAFIAEIVRAGIQSVGIGQSEAARALGLSESQRLQLIVLPQALRVIIPPLTSQYLNLVKNSSLAIAVGYPDMWSVAFTTLNQSGQSVQVFLIIMSVYLMISLIISFILNWYNRRIALVER